MTNLTESEPQAVEAPPAETSPVDDGQAAVEASTDEPVVEDSTPAEPEYDFLDTDEVGEKHVKVKVDGEELVVPLKEALQGYQRQEDYTRKTQQAAEALRLQQAMQNNPELTMRTLAAQRGMSVEQFLNLTPAQQQQAPQPAPEDIPPEDPVERRLWEQDRRVRQLEAEIENRRADEQLHTVVNGLKQQGASDEDVRGAVQAAVMLSERTGRVIGPEFLPMIYQSMQFQKLTAAQQAQQAHSAAQQADDAKRQAAAAQQAQVVASEAASAANTQSVNPAGQPMTAAEAVEQAFASLGYD